MTCCRVGLLLVALLAGVDGAGDANDAALLKGSWRVVATEFNGKALPEESLRDRKIVFEGDRMLVYVGEEKKRTLTFRLDPKQKPKHIDLTQPDKDRSAQGIYALEKDELKLCYGEPGDPRPTTFASPEGKKVFLLVLRREGR